MNIKKDIFIKALKKPNSIVELPDVVHLSIDSRTITPGDIFIALKGELHDGHDYIKDAIARGAAMVVAERAPTPNDTLVVVPDTLLFFATLAREHLRQFSLKKIAITGSNGKTTTKEMLKAVLESELGNNAVYASEGNKNNHFGVPISAFCVNAGHQIAIFEMGMNHEGEIAHLCRIVEPDFGVITNISGAHVGNFSDGILGVKRAKGELFAYLADNGGHAVINLDDEMVRDEAKKHGVKNATTFGTKTDADVSLIETAPFFIAKGYQEIKISVNHQTKNIMIPLAGEHHAKNATAALACAYSLLNRLDKCDLALMNMKMTPGRMSVFSHHKGYVVINDGYNANPASMKAGIVASQEFVSTRRIAVIGAMGELGSSSEQAHFDLGTYVAKNFDRIFVCGKAAEPLVNGAISCGKSNDAVFFAETSNELVKPIKDILKNGDLVFIKGSLSANMKVVANALTLEDE